MSDPNTQPTTPDDPLAVPITVGPHAGSLKYSNRFLYRLGKAGLRLGDQIDYAWTLQTVWAMLDKGTHARFADPEDLSDHITPKNWPDYAAKVLEVYKAAGIGEKDTEKKSTRKGG